MRWTPGGASDDVEDRRNESGGGGFQIGGRHIGLGGFLILLVLSLVFHRNFLALLGPTSGGTVARPADPARDAAEQHEKDLVSFVLDDTQKTWTQIFASRNLQYRHAKLVLFRDQIDSACGMAESATGPFYCLEHEKVYIDLGFYDELKQRFGAPAADHIYDHGARDGRYRPGPPLQAIQLKDAIPRRAKIIDHEVGAVHQLLS